MYQSFTPTKTTREELIMVRKNMFAELQNPWLKNYSALKNVPSKTVGRNFPFGRTGHKGNGRIYAVLHGEKNTSATSLLYCRKISKPTS
ncbi:hypothetical protein OUZ56_026929 [Daphnia magna]|uniref:Uncharacterized protein n=1 Tax=Daphnia magna TaxID=35525 RepID=A0ABQ9ZN85_9CRUS|nr:hypothetical protein OUZ56_026929 [Daphnia magna]